MHERCVWQVAHAVVQVADEMFSGSESVRLVADHPGLVVEPFDRAVIDGHMKPGQDVLLMATNHPGEFANGSSRECVAHQNHCLRYLLAQAFVL